MDKPILVELKGIRKSFGSVKANDGVDLTIYGGEIHAILGENGSGKSTLMNILSGLYAQDSGDIIKDGKKITFRSPKDAMDHGIGMIHQHFKLVDALLAWENIVGGRKQKIFLDKKNSVLEIKKLCEKYKLSMDPEKKVAEMTIGEKQTVEIVKALYRGARILILDEPTTVLTEQEAEQLFTILREMSQKGCAVIIITHKLQEVMEVSERVTVLRKGVSTQCTLTQEADAEKLAHWMVGREIDITVPYEAISSQKKQPVVVIRGLQSKGNKGGIHLHIDKLEVNSYEILGIAGVADSGQKELCEALTGIQQAEGSVQYKGAELIGMGPGAMNKAGIQIGFVPEDRLGMGLAEGLDICDNIALRSYNKKRGLFLNKREEAKEAAQMISDYSVSTSGIHQPIQSLSGGNIQKILLGREINRGVDFFIAEYPVRGLDIGASNFIYNKLNEEKKKGTAILFVGEDLDVLLGICDRIAVLHGGRLMGVVDAQTTTKKQLGLLMMGVKQEETYAKD